FLLALVVPATLTACGGGSSSSTGSSSADPQQVLDQTFSNNTKVTSGNIDINISASAEGSQSGSGSLDISGPFQQTSPTTFPELDLAAKVSADAAGQSFNLDGGVTATKDQAFVTYKGQAYEVPQSAFQQFQQ